MKIKTAVIEATIITKFERIKKLSPHSNKHWIWKEKENLSKLS